MLKEIRKISPDTEIKLLSFVTPWGFFRNRRKMLEMRKELCEKNITFNLFPMIFNTEQSLLLQFCILFWILPLLLYIITFRPSTIHPRGYIAAFLSQIIAKLSGTRVIFDPRGPYPEERVINGTWKRTDHVYVVWKRIENFLIRNCYATVGVTPEFRDEFSKRGAKLSLFIPNRTKVNRFENAMLEYRAKHLEGYFNRNVELLYTGEFFSVWNNPLSVVKCLKLLKKAYPKAVARVITNADKEKVVKVFTNEGLSENDVVHLSGTPEQMPSLVQGCTFSFMFSVSPHSLWPVKMSEYAAAGIPIILDSSFTGYCAEVVLRHRLGIVVDSSKEESLEMVKQVLDNWQQWSDNCISYSKRRLDISSTAKQYLRLYSSINQNS